VKRKKKEEQPAGGEAPLGYLLWHSSLEISFLFRRKVLWLPLENNSGDSRLLFGADVGRWGFGVGVGAGRIHRMPAGRGAPDLGGTRRWAG
jgi:hypothetical protein